MDYYDDPRFYDFLFKVVLIGDSSVGKSCIVRRFKTGCYYDKESSTIGVDFAMKPIRIGDKVLKLQIWDTGGQERFRSITQSYYRSASAIIIVYDITKMASFVGVPRWINDVKAYAPTSTVMLLLGNKCDLTHQREVSQAEAAELAERYRFQCGAIEVSAKENFSIDLAFIRIGEELLLANDAVDRDKVRGKVINIRNPNSARSDIACCR